MTAPQAGRERVRRATPALARGWFIAFEGVEGAGKTTQLDRLRRELEARGHEVVATREPGGTPVGERIRAILLDPVAAELQPRAEALLFAAARAQLVDQVIRPALARGADVVCDRYLDSSLAYQGLARGLGVEHVLELNLLATGGLLPDRTFLLVLPLDEAADRQDAEPDRIEREGAEFAANVDRAYRELAEIFAQRIVALDGTKEPEDLAETIRGQLRDLS
jgi:dTMP kinase